jgi:hypothetical protein
MPCPPRKRGRFSIISGFMMVLWKARESREPQRLHVQEMIEKLGVETRGAATVRALEALNP